MAHKRTQVESSADLGFDGVSPQNLSQWVHNFLNQFKEGKTKIRGSGNVGMFDLIMFDNSKVS
jgi:hypothetical protein